MTSRQKMALETTTRVWDVLLQRAAKKVKRVKKREAIAINFEQGEVVWCGLNEKWDGANGRINRESLVSEWRVDGGPKGAILAPQIWRPSLYKAHRLIRCAQEGTVVATHSYGKTSGNEVAW